MCHCFSWAEEVVVLTLAQSPLVVVVLLELRQGIKYFTIAYLQKEGELSSCLSMKHASCSMLLVI